MAAGTPAISVIVVTHQSVGSVRRCLTSLRAHPGRRGHEVIVVDNASKDGTAELIMNEFPEARLVVAPKRRGFAANCNAGSRLARGRTLLFLNPDAEVRPGAIDELFDALELDPTIAIAGPRLVYPDGSEQASARRFPSPMATLIRRSPLRWVMKESRWEHRHLMMDHVPEVTGDGTPSAVDWVLGAAMAIPASRYRDLGGMDDGYRLYCEDIDLCWRAWQAGFRVVLVPGATFVHDLGELTRRRFATRATVWHVGSMARFVSRHGIPRPGAWRIRPLARHPRSSLAPTVTVSDSIGRS